ncbi:hypothetical protein [Streptomyces cahuitamycinicus]|uniref:Gliding motility protein n=1 Tax=Streptomyces cahuitamycinicus TaxID=2070367 RepID=A0A2N8THN9_9ACTN|nr:hypothetical protein [Streptomyces cahuitamycinicus]PNG18515.1 hypothetical protein C1J00_30725 [Streptomyces cahuitamycinicus]
MGVFARLLRRSKATAETPAAEAQTDTAKAGTEDEAAEAAEAKGTDGAGEATDPAGETAAEVTEPEGVDIPKQQSTEKAADNEAGEGART